MSSNSHLPAIIDTERMLLKEMTPEYWSYAWNNWTEEELKANFGYTDKELPIEKEKHRMGLQTYHISFRNFVMVTKDTHTVLGRIGYHTWYTRHHRAELGYHITDTEQRNKGYISEALKAVLIYGFDKMGLYRAEALTAPDNMPSIKALLKHGFQLEGVLRSHYYINDEHSDSNCYSLLLPEYEKLKNDW